MSIKILTKEIDNLPGYSRIEEDHKISIKRNDDPEVDTPCGFPFDEDSYGCRTCDNKLYCKENERRRK